MDHYHASSSDRKKKSQRNGILAIAILVGMAILSLWLNSDHASTYFQTMYTIRMLSNNNNNIAEQQQQKDDIYSNDKDDGGSVDGQRESSLYSNNTDVTGSIPAAMPSHAMPSSTSSSSLPTIKNASSETNNYNARVLSIVVQLSGELGNQVYKMAHGLCLQDLIQHELGIHTKLVLRAQNHPKWKHAMEWTQQAFPKTRALNFREGNTPEFDTIHKVQAQWMDQLLKDDNNIPDPSLLQELSCSNATCYADMLNLLNYTWNHQDRPRIPHGEDSKSPIISMPHLYINSFAGNYCWDRMYDAFQDSSFWELDDSICRQTPDPNESVLHLRNYLVEMPRKGKQLGFEQLGPKMTASRLFANHGPGDKVAIISRFPEKSLEFVEALQAKGMQVRLIQNQTGNQDFCFLYKAQKEIIGQRVSTFVSLAGILGNAKKVRLYSVESLETRSRNMHFFNESFQHQALRNRIVYENYNLTH